MIRGHFNCAAAIGVAADPASWRWRDFFICFNAVYGFYQKLLKFDRIISQSNPGRISAIGGCLFMYEDLIKEIADLLLLITDQSKLKRIIAFIRSMM